MAEPHTLPTTPASTRWTYERSVRHLVESCALAVWEADAMGFHLPRSSTWPALTGQTEEESAGNGWLEAVHPDDRKGAEAGWNSAVADGGNYEHEYRVAASGRGWLWTLARAVPVPDHDGTVRGWIGMNLNISVRKAAEHGLQEASRQKNEFISILAHELRNPLAPLRSSIDMLLSETATSFAKARALAAVNRQAHDLARLVEGLVDASRIATGTLQVNLQKLRLLDSLRNAMDNSEPSARAKSQEVALEVVDGIDPHVDADPMRLNQAFVNVLSNSIKFSPEKSKIDIAVRRSDEKVSVVIRDRGRELPETDHSKIFELFAQSARHDLGDGLGIGLALARDIITLHGGTLEALTPADGIGVEFEMMLPAFAFSAAEQEAADVELSSSAAHSVRVLVVDDNADAAETLGAVLEMSGQTVHIVHDGRKAVEESADFLPEVIFMDIGMPVMGGLEATRHIRDANPSVRPFIVALTGWSSAADRDASREAGCDLHLAKPAEISEVLAAIQQACERA